MLYDFFYTWPIIPYGYIKSLSQISQFQVLKDGLSILHVPYAYGFAIILLTVLVKAATFPLTKKQVCFYLTCEWLEEEYLYIMSLISYRVFFATATSCGSLVF